MDFNNDELSLLFVMSESYIRGIKLDISQTLKSKSRYKRMIVLRNSAVALRGKLSSYLKARGISIENEE